MKRWNNIFTEPTSKEHDEKVLAAAQYALTSQKVHQGSFWKLVIDSCAYTGWLRGGMVTAGIAGSLYVLLKPKANQDHLELQAADFNQQFNDVSDSPEDIEFLAYLDLEFLEDFELLEQLMEES